MPEIVRLSRRTSANDPAGTAVNGGAYENRFFWDSVRSPARGQSLWENCPFRAIDDDPIVGPYYFEDFLAQTIASNTIGGWTFTQATSGGVTLDTTNGNGVALISAGAVTAGQGANWQMTASPFTVTGTRGLWFEARIQVTGLSTTPKVQFLAGLAAQSTALITSNALATTDMIAFQGVSTTGVVLGTTQASSTATTGTGLTWADSTWHKLGFYANAGTVNFWVDGVIVSTSTTNIPTSQLAPAFCMQADGTVTPVMNVDYLRVVGLR